MANKIDINDFGLFFDTLKSVSKVLDGTKLLFSPRGLEIYGARNTEAICEFTTNAVTSKDEFDICIDSVSMLLKILSTVKEVHENDFSDVEFSYSRPNIHIKSKKIKLKCPTCNEATISKWVYKKLDIKMDSVFDFKTTSDFIKRINGHAFMFDNTGSINIYLETKPDMEQNAVFATIGNKKMDIGKELTLKFGLVTSGQLQQDKPIIIDFNRMNMFNCMPSNEISLSLTDKNVLMSHTHTTKGTSYMDVTIYCTVLKG